MGLVFNGSNTRVDCGSGSSIDNPFATGGTVTAWVLLTAYGEFNVGRVMDKSSDASVSDGWAFFVAGAVSGDDNCLRFTHGRAVSANTWAAPTNSVTLGPIYHLAVTFDKSTDTNVPSLYVNGEVQSITTPVAGSGAYADDSAQTLSIGNRSASADRSFDGFIEDVRVYNVILTAEQIMTMFQAQGHDNLLNGLQARWLLNELSPGVSATEASSIIDMSINKNVGTPVNSPFYESSFLSKTRRILRNR